MILTYVAVRRYAANQETYRQMIATLSRLTEAGGYTLPDHGSRVADLAVAMARALGLSSGRSRMLEYAALLHDLGQIALREPIPGGATVLAAPSDQRRIAADGARIMRHAGVLDAAAALIEVQATPYRQVRELSEDVPMASRIIKVANAYDDLTAGGRGSDAQDRALERILLGLGYEYDPAVVDALERSCVPRCCTRRGPNDRAAASGLPRRDRVTLEVWRTRPDGTPGSLGCERSRSCGASRLTRGPERRGQPRPTATRSLLNHARDRVRS